MSDYEHNKVVRLPFPKELLSKSKAKDPWDCEQYLKEKLGDLFHKWDCKTFTIGSSDKNYYIDWVYYHTYGEESAHWANVRILTQKELDAIKPYFDKLEVNYNDEDLRVVDYCYYNSCEPPDYYEIIDQDDSDEFID